MLTSIMSAKNFNLLANFITVNFREAKGKAGAGVQALLGGRSRRGRLLELRRLLVPHA